MRRRLILLCVAAAGFYGAVVATVFFSQRSLLYVPDRAIQSPAAYELPELQELTVTTDDETTLQLWYAPPANPAMSLIVYFPGNAGNLGDRNDKFRSFINAGYGVLALSYRGFGNSGGEPSEEGLYQDARAALSFADAVGHASLVIYGESLGSGVAVQMATERPNLAALILEAPYTSVADRAQEVYFWLPAHWMVRDRFESLTKIKEIVTPLLILHGAEDATIPVAHGKTLFAQANEPKTFHLFSQGTHSNLWDLGAAAVVQEFLRNHSL